MDMDVYTSCVVLQTNIKSQFVRREPWCGQTAQVLQQEIQNHMLDTDFPTVACRYSGQWEKIARALH